MLTYLKTLSIDDSISDKLLTLNLTTLLALTGASRASEITALDVRFLGKGPKSYFFTFTKISKTWKKGKKAPVKEFKYFEDSSLCVCKTIDQYLERTRPWREGKNQLLLATLKPHNEVQTSTVSGWLVKTLALAGIDTNIFSAHSTRSASTTKAKNQGVSVEDIVKQGQWSSDSMLRKCYY